MEDLRELLKSGRVIKVRNGSKYLICGDNLIRNEGYVHPIYNKHLQAEGDNQWDIMKIYQPVYLNINQIFDGLDEAEVIWSRSKERPYNLKDLLQTGMRATTREGDTYLVLKGSLPTAYYGTQELMFINDSFLIGNDYNEQLIRTQGSHDYDIIKVETVYGSSFNGLLTREPLEVIYEEDQD